MTFMTIPSTISGGASIFQVRIGSGEVLSAGDEADVLLCFYQHSYDGHIGSLKKGGIVLFDSDHVQPNPDWQPRYHHVGVPISSLTVEAVGGTGREKGKNIYALGLIARMFHLDVPKLTKLIEERFKGKIRPSCKMRSPALLPDTVIKSSICLEVFKFHPSDKASRGQVVMSGNEALTYGLIAAGVRFGAVIRSRRGRTSWRRCGVNCQNTVGFSSNAKTKSPPSRWRSGPATPDGWPSRDHRDRAFR
jgi:2-oxoglutarate ferredoxin oxidoreductase subunit alpha